ncbi:hypothetical protein ACOZDZ_09665, partial [Streptomyces griseoincarnatus]
AHPAACDAVAELLGCEDGWQQQGTSALPSAGGARALGTTGRSATATTADLAVGRPRRAVPVS